MARLGRLLSFIALLVTGAICLQFLGHVFTRSVEEFSALGMALFGASLALSATCYTVVPNLPEGERCDLKYAGEKFLHAGALFLQAIAVNYVAATGSKWLDDMHWQNWPVLVLAGLLYIGTGGFGAQSFLLGFNRLNEWLWNRWVKRAAVLHAKEKERKAARRAATTATPRAEDAATEA